VVYNLSHFKEECLTKKELNQKNIKDYIIASATCFPAFKMKKINDEKYIDGGFYDNLPINLAIDMGAEEIIAVDLGAIGLMQKVKENHVKVITIKPNNDLGSFLIFDKRISRRNICYGYNDTMKVYKKLDGNKFTYKKGNLFENYTRYNVKFVANIKKFLATRSLDKTIIDEIIYPQSLNKFLNTKDYKFISDTMNKVLEYAGELLKLDDSIIYSINYYNVLLKREIDKYQAFSRSYIKNMILHKKGRKTHNRRAIVKYFYDAFNKHNATKLEIISLAIIFPKEFLTAIYIYTI
jgi:NTE family protein